MSTFREKHRAAPSRWVGQMIGDEQLVEDGREQERKSRTASQVLCRVLSSRILSQADSSQAKSSDDPSGHA